MSAEATSTRQSVVSELTAKIFACSRDEKQAILIQLLRDLYGSNPEKEHSLWNEDNSSYLFLVPPHIHVQYQMTPEFIAELDRRAAEPRENDIPLSETIAKLEALHKEYEGKRASIIPLSVCRRRKMI